MAMDELYFAWISVVVSDRVYHFPSEPLLAEAVADETGHYPCHAFCPELLLHRL